MTPLPEDDLLFDPIGATEQLLTQDRAREVADTCARLIKAGRGGALLRASHGRALIALGLADEAVVVLREASQLSPNTAELLLAFGEALTAIGSLPAAIGELQRAARLAPDDARPHLKIAELWIEAGEAEKALSSLQDAQLRGPLNSDEVLKFKSRAEKMSTEARANAGYVKHLFNQFASDYDERMQGRLGYAAPAILRQLAGMLVMHGTLHEILDLGCGTGLGGMAFRDIARSCTGVDLSPRMLERAKATGAYERLLEGDIEDAGLLPEGPFDLVIAADVLVYIGDLGSVFMRASERCRRGGLFLFTTERGETLDHEVGPKRRYRHSETYLRRLAGTHGFEIASLVECVCRHEAGEPVASWAGAFRAI